MPASSGSRPAVKPLRFLVGLAAGVLFVCLFYPAAYLLACLLARAGLPDRWPQIILCALCVLVLPLFFWLRKKTDRLLACGQIAFPAGAFLAADLMMLAIPVFDLLNAARLLEYADKSQPLARQFAYNSVVLIFGLVLLVLCWLISVLWKLLLRFRAMTEALEREEAREKAAAAATPHQTPAAPDKPSAGAGLPHASDSPSQISPALHTPDQTPAAFAASPVPDRESLGTDATHSPDVPPADTTPTPTAATLRTTDQADADAEEPHAPEQTPAAPHMSDAPSVTAELSPLAESSHASDQVRAETEATHTPDQVNADQEPPRTPDQTDANTDTSAQ